MALIYLARHNLPLDYYRSRFGHHEAFFAEAPEMLAVVAGSWRIPMFF